MLSWDEQVSGADGSDQPQAAWWVIAPNRAAMRFFTNEYQWKKADLVISWNRDNLSRAICAQQHTWKETRAGGDVSRGGKV